MPPPKILDHLLSSCVTDLSLFPAPNLPFKKHYFRPRFTYLLQNYVSDKKFLHISIHTIKIKRYEVDPIPFEVNVHIPVWVFQLYFFRVDHSVGPSDFWNFIQNLQHLPHVFPINRLILVKFISIVALDLMKGDIFHFSCGFWKVQKFPKPCYQARKILLRWLRVRNYLIRLSDFWCRMI